MARPKSPQPAYCHHKKSGRAFVKLNGRFVYLGDYGTQASRDEYLRVVGEWITSGRQKAPKHRDEPAASRIGPTVQQVLAAFWVHAKAYYVNPDGSPAGELDNFRLAMIPLRRMYAETPAADFGPLALKTVREEMVKPYVVTDAKTKVSRTLPGWSRTYVNRQTARLKQIFKWATENEVVPAGVYLALAAVSGLRKGRGAARESEPVAPAPDADVDAALAHLGPRLQAMVKLQRSTGMRSSEVCTMTTGAIDRSGPLWVYRPAHHKTAHHGHDREIYLNAEAQAVLSPYLKLDPAAFVFSPLEAEAERREKSRAARKTPVQPSQAKRAEAAARRSRRRAPGPRWTRESYRKAIARACRKAGVAVWHPHQLRHSYGTLMRKRHGIETARILLGHKSPAMTLIYAEADRAKAMHAVAAG